MPNERHDLLQSESVRYRDSIVCELFPAYDESVPHGGTAMPSENEPREYTPDELKKIYSKFKKEFTCEKLIEYLQVDGEQFPLDQVLSEADEIVRKYKTSRSGGA